MLSTVKIEQCLLNCIYDNPSLVYQINNDYWYSATAKAISHTIKELYENKLKITEHDIVTIGNKKHSDITDENISHLRALEYSPDSFDFYVNELKKIWARNDISDVVLKDILIETSSKQSLNISKLKILAHDILDKIEIIEGSVSKLQDISSIISEYELVIAQRKRGEYKYTTGDSFLDMYLSQGFMPGEITTLFGATGVGKSLFALNLINKQINKRIPSVYITLEMSSIATMDRLMAIRSKLSITSETSEEDKIAIWDTLSHEAQTLSIYKKNFLLVDDSSLSLDELETIIKKAQERIGSKYLIVTIDLFTMLSDVGQKPNDIEDAMNRLHAIVKASGIHCVVVVQANRDADSYKIKDIDSVRLLKPTINNIKNAHAIAERSRLVMSIFRPKYYASRLFPTSEKLEIMDDTLEVQILKQSNGKVGDIVKYLYDAKYFSIYPFIDEE